MPKSDLKKVVKHTSTWVLSCKFAAYFQNTFSKEHLWRDSSANLKMLEIIQLSNKRIDCPKL